MMTPLDGRETILELASRGPGGEFDAMVMSALYNAGLVTVGEEDRQVRLTELGQQTYRVLCASDGAAE